MKGKENMNLEELDQVVGGFKEQNSILPTEGMEVECPICHNTDKEYFAGKALYDSKIGSVEYWCSCGCKFVCYQGTVSPKEEFKKLCQEKGIDYRF